MLNNKIHKVEEKRKPKSLILDFGYVLCYPTTGDWFITPWFSHYIKEHGLDRKVILKNTKGFGDILDRQIRTMSQEVEMFYDFYEGVFEKAGYDISPTDIYRIAEDITISTTKYKMFEGVREELVALKDYYDLILLSDNWPCGEYLMDEWDLSQYFKDIYISSYYGIKKDNPDFFKIPMEEHHIDASDAIFVDDSDVPLNTAIGLGIDSYKMDRYNNIKESNYNVIHDLNCLCRKKS
jgi:HAD superfamily hydrolase (TIGR01509 family)